MKRLDVARNYPLTLVMGDVNGLKLINDSFGHATGDKLLICVAEVLSKGCRRDDIIARLGGDEFVILLPNTDTAETEEILKRINALALKERVGSVELSISFGYETKRYEEQDFHEVFKKAEDAMYKAHHERWDGLGYPKGLKGEELPIQPRIIAIADSYDAMTSSRSYRGALSSEVAIQELQKNAGTQLDPDLVKLFIDKVINSPLSGELCQ